MLNQKQITGIKSRLDKNGQGFPLVFRALGDPCRFRIFKVLMRYRGTCVTDIANIFSITVSAASQQLRILERLGLILKVRMGQMVCYELKKDNPIVKQLIQFLRSSG